MTGFEPRIFPTVPQLLPMNCIYQCDQIGRFFRLWATFQSLWQKLIWPNLIHSLGIFVKVSKSLIFLMKSFLATFIDTWLIFTGHTGTHLICEPRCPFIVQMLM